MTLISFRETLACELVRKVEDIVLDIWSLIFPLLEVKDKVSLRTVNKEFYGLLSPIIYDIVDTNGTLKWYKEGKLHRDGDEPAEIWANKTQRWYKEGNQHRDGDEPAVIQSNGTRFWYKEGERHRDGYKPAIICLDGAQIWYKEGKRCLDEDKPVAI
jgi:hypothetical protein